MLSFDFVRVICADRVYSDRGSLSDVDSCTFIASSIPRRTLGRLVFGFSYLPFRGRDWELRSYFA